MAEQLSLVRGYDFEADQGTVSLISGTDGFDVAYQGWTPGVTPDRKGLVNEAITVRVQGTSTDQIAASLQKLADKAEETQRYYTNGARDYAVWFRVQFNGETKGRQSLVREIRHEPASSVYDYALRQAYHWNKYTVGITREPWWEGTACGTISTGLMGVIGGTFAYGTIAGDLPSRIAQVKLSNTGTIFPNGKAWIGFKSNRYGSVSSFTPYWSFAEASYLGAAGSVIADTSTQGGTRTIFCDTGGTPYTAGTQLWAMTLEVGAGIGTSSYMNGDYLVLMRAKLPGSAEYLVQMKAGLTEDYYVPSGGVRQWPNAKSYPRVSIAGTGDAAGTAWHFYEMGNISIPPDRTLKNQINMAQYGLMFYAERISGTVLYFDGVVFVPLDGFVRAGKFDDITTLISTQTNSLIAVNGPDNIFEACVIGSATHPKYGTVSTSLSSPTPSFIGGLDPGYSGVLVLAAERLSGSLLTNQIDVEIKYFERWKEARGND